MPLGRAEVRRRDVMRSRHCAPLTGDDPVRLGQPARSPLAMVDQVLMRSLIRRREAAQVTGER